MHHHRAFTLLELLTVLFILALLAAFLFPALAQSREHARASSCLSNVRQLSLAQALYIDDYDDQLPHWWQPAPERKWPYSFWPERFLPYVRTTDVFHCPSFRGQPPGRDGGDLLAGYALFTWGPSGAGTSRDPYWRWAGPPLTLSQILRPSETFNLMDGWTTTEVCRGLMLRHRHGMNAAFLDGHARFVTAAQAAEISRRGGQYFYKFIAADK